VGNGAGRAIDLEDELYPSRLPHSLVLAAAGTVKEADGARFYGIGGR
jgi:hypothetical protein